MTLSVPKVLALLQTAERAGAKVEPGFVIEALVAHARELVALRDKLRQERDACTRQALEKGADPQVPREQAEFECGVAVGYGACALWLTELIEKP